MDTLLPLTTQQHVVLSAWAALLGDDDGDDALDGTQTLVPRVAAVAPNLVVKPAALPPGVVRTLPNGGGVVLDVSYDKCAHLAAAVAAHVDDCTALHACRSKLAAVPVDLACLRRLRVLDLSFNRLAQLPDDVGALAELAELDVRCNALTAIPRGLRACQRLTRLHLHRNKLAELPDVFEAMRALQVLDASCNEIETIAPSLWTLGASLRVLNLERNRLTELPSAVGSLTSVTKLSLGHNRIRRLPVELGRLTALEELDLSFNAVERLPTDTLGKLAALRELSLRGNAFNELPTDIADLAKLEAFDIRQTAVKMLPLECARLKALEALLLDAQHFVRPPADVCRRGAEAMLRFLDSARQANIPSDGVYAVSGDGLARSIEAAPQLSFTIRATDGKQRPLPIVPGSLSVLVDVIQAPDEADETMASLPVKVTLRDEQLGVLAVSYDATIAGHYIIRVMASPKTHLPGSPFHVNVTHGPLHPPSCVIVRSAELRLPPGSALSWTALTLPAGKEDTLAVLRCDRFGNRIPVGAGTSSGASTGAPMSDDVAVQLVEASPRPADPTKALKMSVIKAGTTPAAKRDLVTVTGQVVGRYRVAVSMQGVPLRASPVDLTIVPGPVSPLHCTVSVTGTRSAVLNTETTFVIQARDALGNARTTGGDVFDAMITTTESNTVEYPVAVLDNQNGECLGTYRVGAVGTFLLHVRLQRKDNGTLVPIQGSPFQLTVTDRKTPLQDQFEVENLLLSNELAQVTARLHALQMQVGQQSEAAPASVSAAPAPAPAPAATAASLNTGSAATNASMVNSLRQRFEKISITPSAVASPTAADMPRRTSLAAPPLVQSSAPVQQQQQQPPPPPQQPVSLPVPLDAVAAAAEALYLPKDEHEPFVTFLLRRSDRLPLLPWPCELLVQTASGLAAKGETDRAEAVVRALLDQLAMLVRSETMDVRELSFWLSNLIHLSSRLPALASLPAGGTLREQAKGLTGDILRLIAKVVQTRLSPGIVRAFFDQHVETDFASGPDQPADGAAAQPAPPLAGRARSTTAITQPGASAASAPQSHNLEPIMSLVHAALVHFETNGIPAETVNALVSQWLFYIDAVLLNSLLIRRKCSGAFLNAFTWTLTQWESWVQQRRTGFVPTVTGGPGAALLDRNKTLVRTTQAIRLLQTPRLASREPGEVVKHITHLTPAQVQKLLTTVDEFKVSPAKQLALVEALKAQGAPGNYAPFTTRRNSSSGSGAADDGLFVDTFHMLPLAVPTEASQERVVLPTRMIPPMVQRVPAF